MNENNDSNSENSKDEDYPLEVAIVALDPENQKETGYDKDGKIVFVSIS